MSKLDEAERERLKKKYELLKKQISKMNDDETLRKYEILSEAYSIGKKMYGQHYSYSTLAIDFETPYTTVKRVTSLDRATPKTWKLIKSGELSAFKAAQICATKDRTFQDEIVKIVIDNKLSTYQIKKLNIQKQEDLKKERLKIAVDKGFARADTAWISFRNTLDRMDILLLMDVETIPEFHRINLIKRLKSLESRIKKFCEKAKDNIYK